MKKWDFVIITTLIISSFIPSILLGYNIYTKPDLSNNNAEVRVNGKVVQVLPLTENNIYIISENGNTNVIEVLNGSARIVNASCRDGLCIKHKAISNNGQSIICLPNKMQLNIKGANNSLGYDILIN